MINGKARKERAGQGREGKGKGTENLSEIGLKIDVKNT